MTARDDFASKQRGCRAGIDDYMVKPIDLDELFLRVGALLRRAKTANSHRLEVGKLGLDADDRTACLDGEEIPFLLLLHINRNTRDMVAEWKRYRACGVVLLFTNIILTGMDVLVLRRGEGFVYIGYLICIMALYDFYTMAMVIVNLVKNRKQKSPS